MKLTIVTKDTFSDWCNGAFQKILFHVSESFFDQGQSSYDHWRDVTIIQANEVSILLHKLENI